MDPQEQTRGRNFEVAPQHAARDPESTPFPFNSRASMLLSEQLRLIEELASAHDLPCTEEEQVQYGVHTTRVAEIAALLAQLLDLPEAEVSLIRRAAPLHDLGKMVIPEEILLKPSSLNEEEFAIVKTHAAHGERLLVKAGVKSRLLAMAAEIARTHHEHWDGTGYPNGLRGDQIPLVGRIVAVADVFDALTRTRPYKARWSAEEALAAIIEQQGKKFDPSIVDALLLLYRSGALSAAQEAASN